MSSFQCKICKQSLNFQYAQGIVDFMVSLLQFYQEHDKCETLQANLSQLPQKAEKESVVTKVKIKKNNKRNKKKK